MCGFAFVLRGINSIAGYVVYDNKDEKDRIVIDLDRLLYKFQ